MACISGALGLFGVTLVSSFGAFGRALSVAKKSDSKNFDAGFADGVSLASRALGRATIYAVCGVGLLTFVVCKLMDVHSAYEFRMKMEAALKSRMPDIRRNTNPGRSEFSSFRELFEYIEKGESKEAEGKKAESNE